jgi:hypothetical protein
VTGFERADLSREQGWAHCVIDLLQLVAADVAHELSEASGATAVVCSISTSSTHTFSITTDQTAA